MDHCPKKVAVSHEGSFPFAGYTVLKDPYASRLMFTVRFPSELVVIQQCRAR